MSQILIKKSQENIESSKILIDNKKFNSSIHCSYYSCYQLIMLYLEKSKIKEEEIDHSCKDENNKIRGLHAKTISRYFEQYTSSHSNGINRKMSALRVRRNEADYHNKKMYNFGVSNQSLTDAIEINKFIQEKI